MLYANRFAGHLDPLDPRNLLTGSGGCSWPTIPAYRYTVASAGAWGVWDFLNDTGILLEMDPFIRSPGRCQWNGPINPAPITYCTLLKWWDVTALLNRWSLQFQHLLCQHLIVILWATPIERCNKDRALRKFSCPGEALLGDSGPFPWLMQTEWDKDAPPVWPIEP